MNLAPHYYACKRLPCCLLSSTLCIISCDLLALFQGQNVEQGLERYLRYQAPHIRPPISSPPYQAPHIKPPISDPPYQAPHIRPPISSPPYQTPHIKPPTVSSPPYQALNLNMKPPTYHIKPLVLDVQNEPPTYDMKLFELNR